MPFRPRLLLWGFAFAVTFTAVARCEARGSTADPLTVATDLGPVRGILDGGVRKFLGIPYAAPPVGGLRWQLPRAPQPWTTARDATKARAQCPQILPVVNVETGEENCLFVNVFAPNPRPRRPAPVMAWIHGGGFTVGSGLDNDPTRLVAKAGVVVVTLNYRLGPLGFLAHPLLSAEARDQAAGNLGLQDQQEALRWVRHNARAFGGNPRNVTIFGESAGGMSVCAHLLSGSSRGLFRRAITQSGPCMIALPPRATAEAQGERFARQLGCDAAPDVLACLRAKTVHDVLFALPPDPTFLFDLSVNWIPTADGVVLPEDVVGAIERGRFRRVPIMVGANRDEGRLFVGIAFNVRLGSTTPHPITADEWPARVDAYFGPTVGPQVRLRYPLANYPDPGAAFGQAIGDAVLACPVIEGAKVLARHTKVFLYHYEHEPNPFVLPMEGIALGAFHAAELPYVFGGSVQSSGGIVFTEAEQRLSELMMDAWARFAARGRPGSAALAWPRLDRRARHRVFDTPPALGQDLKRDVCGFWSESGWTLAGG
jgi:para-nitrobenzyl esterase